MRCGRMRAIAVLPSRARLVANDRAIVTHRSAASGDSPQPPSALAPVARARMASGSRRCSRRKCTTSSRSASARPAHDLPNAVLAASVLPAGSPRRLFRAWPRWVSMLKVTVSARPSALRNWSHLRPSWETRAASAAVNCSAVRGASSITSPSASWPLRRRWQRSSADPDQSRAGQCRIDAALSRTPFELAKTRDRRARGRCSSTRDANPSQIVSSNQPKPICARRMAANSSRIRARVGGMTSARPLRALTALPCVIWACSSEPTAG